MEAPPPCRRRPHTATMATTLPALMEELVEEILLRIPPDEPAHLFRAALVCKLWRRIVLSDPGFLRRYRAFHRRRRQTPPLLGFFYNHWWSHDRATGFAPAAAAALPPSLPAAAAHHLDNRAWCVLDCRHGRVLHEDLTGGLMVWDPITTDDASCHELQLAQEDMDCCSYTAAVLCAVAGCDHHSCSHGGGGPFIVVYLGVDYATDDDYDDDVVIKARVYSSEARAWSSPVSSQLGGLTLTSDYLGGHDDLHIYSRAAVVGDEICCVVMPGARIIRYNHVKRCISCHSSPPICSQCEPPVLMQNEDDGSLGLACQLGGIGSVVYLWSSSRMVVDRDRKLVAEWMQERVIELDKILPIDMSSKHYCQVYLAGFAEGVGVLFFSTDVGAFTFELKSGEVRKVQLGCRTNKVDQAQLHFRIYIGCRYN